jgi:hypothetical protein
MVQDNLSAREKEAYLFNPDGEWQGLRDFVTQNYNQKRLSAIGIAFRQLSEKAELEINSENSGIDWASESILEKESKD